MTEFTKGDVVQLKSGGPLMTVADLGDYSFSAGPQNGVKCVWFEKTKNFEDVFDAAVLKKASPGLGSVGLRRA